MMRDLFRGLYDEATALAVEVFEHGQVAHPCAYLVRGAYDAPDMDPPSGWPEDWRRHWQLPETYWGEVENKPPVAFVGINPSIRWDEPCPRHGTDFDEWFGFYRNRLGPGGRLRSMADPGPPLYRFYSDVIKRAFGPAADIDTHAILTDAIHYKSREPGIAQQLRAALAHATSSPLTLELVRRAGCRVVVLAGEDAIAHLAPLLGAAGLPGPMRSVVGRVFDAAHGIKLVPSYHAWDRRKAPVVGMAVARALGLQPAQEETDQEDSSSMVIAEDRITEADLLQLVTVQGLHVSRELDAYRGIDGRERRRLYWRRSALGLPSHIDFSGFTVSHDAVEPVTDNGRVQGRLHCADVSREIAIEIATQALAQLV
jgi:hypothetical protein